MTKYRTPMDRLLANSMPLPWCGCWIWMGATVTNWSGKQYGRLSYGTHRSGKQKGKSKKVLAHRFAIHVATGKPLSHIKAGMHRCPNSLCVKPDHLRGGSVKENNRQTVKDGNHKGIENNYGRGDDVPF